ncbi:uncharacterized protein EV420DRAFT_1645877 [Desarmillaria tabescens]|uniref:Uncharacterized protein n=1 Tax=Armillaria tabescens TaxID=1929756 RepID=A0AA39K2I7_ARMTA|nr:uncharacterized protein EV420DRAFT_1645877 [Desarmillaria tabescens]KAK0451959.1 hypothetical protein EV420DRAFT_1645877 [Desarmillaria tabescens]
MQGFHEWSTIVYNDVSDQSSQSDSSSDNSDHLDMPIPPFSNPSTAPHEQNCMSSTPDVAQQVLSVLDHMRNIGITLAEFLNALSWGNDACITDPRIQGQQTQLMKRAKGGRIALAKFMQETWPMVLNNEMERLAVYFISSSKEEDDVLEKSLTSLDFPTIIKKIREEAVPNLWVTLHSLAYTPTQDHRNCKKDPDTIGRSHDNFHDVLYMLSQM